MAAHGAANLVRVALSSVDPNLVAFLPGIVVCLHCRCLAMNVSIEPIPSNGRPFYCIHATVWYVRIHYYTYLVSLLKGKYM
jgi:hypothetical protein